MKKVLFIFLLLFLIFSSAFIQGDENGKTDEVLIELYYGARVADVVDAMVTIGYMEVGVMDPMKAPLWKEVTDMNHRFSGIAVTARYGPTNHPIHPGVDLTDPANYDAYRKWRGLWYHELSGEPFMVGQIAYQELVDDMVSRRNHYEALGRPLDETFIIPEEPETFFKRLGFPPDPNKP